MFIPKNNSQKGYTLIEILVIVIVIGILASVVVLFWRGFIKNRTVEQALKEATLALREAQSTAQKEKVTYTIRFQNKAGIAQYSIFPEGDSPTDWDSLSNASSVVTSNSEITFDSKGETEQTGEKVILTLNNKKKCLIVDPPLDEIKTAEGNDCH